MRITEIVVHYAEKQSRNYQSVEHALSARVTLDENDDLTGVIEAVRADLRDKVAQFCTEEITALTSSGNGAYKR